MFMVILTLTWALAGTVVWGDTMKGGTELLGNPYSEVVYVQKKPSKTVCFGTVHDETVVFTSGLCEVGDESVESYQVVEIPADLKSGAKTHEIENVTRGLKWPLDAKMITLKNPGFKSCPKCPVPKALWLKWYRDFNQSVQEHSKAIVYGFGPPLKAAVMAFKTKDADDCVKDYDRVREESWPEIPPRYLFCVYEGPSQLQLRLSGDSSVNVSPGITCDDSVGSLVKIKQQKVIGIILKAFCGNDRLAALGIAGYYLMKYRPDKNWVPGTTTATAEVSPHDETPPPSSEELLPTGGGSSQSSGRAPPTEQELPPSGREPPPSGGKSSPTDGKSPPTGREPPSSDQKLSPIDQESPPTKQAHTAACTINVQLVFSHSTKKPKKKPPPNTSVHKKVSRHHFKTPPTIQTVSTASFTSPAIWCRGIFFVLSVRQ